jgi:cell division protein FtsQ
MSAVADSSPDAAISRNGQSKARGLIGSGSGSGRKPAGVVALLTGLLLLAFLYSGLFQINSVTVHGAEYTDVQELIALAAVRDRSVFRTQPEAVAKRIESLSSIQDAQVEVRFPGTVAITIVEPEPVLVIENAGSQALVSADGAVIAERGLEGLPRLLIEGTEPASTFEPSAELVAAVRAIIGLYGDSLDMSWTTDTGLSIDFSDGRIVLIGQPEDIEAKLTVLSAIESQVGSSWSQLDLRVASRPAYR